jgi:hypothetical protein
MLRPSSKKEHEAQVATEPTPPPEDAARQLIRTASAIIPRSSRRESQSQLLPMGPAPERAVLRPLTRNRRLRFSTLYCTPAAVTQGKGDLMRLHSMIVAAAILTGIIPIASQPAAATPNSRTEYRSLSLVQYYTYPTAPYYYPRPYLYTYPPRPYRPSLYYTYPRSYYYPPLYYFKRPRFRY